MSPKFRKEFPGMSMISLRFTPQGMTIDARDAAPSMLLQAWSWHELEEDIIRFWKPKRNKAKHPKR
jgi:hypothetical protein